MRQLQDAPAKSTVALLQRAFAFHQAHRFSDAAELYERVLGAEPRNFDALHLLGLIEQRRGNPARSVSLISQAIAEKPGVAAAHSNRGNAFYTLGQYSNAIADYTSALSLEPGFADAYANRANALRHIGRLQEAVSDYDRAITLNARHVAAHFNKATILRDTGALEEALAGFSRTVALSPGHPNAHKQMGWILAQLKRWPDALLSYEKALAVNPLDPDVHLSHGHLLREMHRLEDAARCYQQAIDIKPDFAPAYLALAVVQQDLGRLAAALQSLDRAVTLCPSVAAHTARGTVLEALGRTQEAVDSYECAISIEPSAWQPHFNKAGALKELSRFPEALVAYDAAVAIKPDFAEAYYGRGIVLRQLARLEDAIQSYDRAISIRPEYAVVYLNRGAAWQDLGRLDRALADYDRAIDIQDSLAEAHYNRGLALRDLTRLEEALASYDRAIVRKADFIDAQLNRALTTLLSGDLVEGFRRYECRRQQDPVAPLRAYKQPLWTGQESLQGKTLFVYWEQGLGDTLQFYRYALMAQRMAARVVLSVQNSLLPLLKQLEPTIQIVRGDEVPSQFDFHVPLMSLPHALGTTLQTIPSASPYLRAEPALIEDWSRRLGEGQAPRIGIAWSGNPQHRNDSRRSVPLQQLVPLLNSNLDWICLQKEVRAGDQPLLAQLPHVRFLGEHLENFAQTAALISHLDVVISVDTSIAHLAGALGKPVWVMLPYVPDWRWLLGRSDSPWYPTARLFRQPRHGDWAAVIGELNRALRMMGA